MINRSAKYLAIAATVFVAVTGIAIPAQAEEAPPIAPNTLAQLNAGFEELGVAVDARPALLEAYAQGKTWDNSSGAAPVTDDTYRVGITDYTRKVYSDGSVTLTSIERPTTPSAGGGIQPMGLSGCKYLLSAGVATWSNCKVEKNNGILTEWYHAGYWQGPSGAGVSLTNTWDWDIQAAGGACSKDYLGTPTSTKARIRAYCTVISGIGSSYPYLDLDVTKSTAAVNANW
ncbi:hypothetical protein [Leifsonia shinshuensis]|uniref:Uncharacterized protein n=1 Tax=Leifsonia shinshuensis TaxID=150026 RepID=A0A7G6YBJ5_9MICO|nr:hypothetical protein [Leifsonia shinshuensis]QNE35860.1 hypothetical protein F1C12_12480 [Leifsonia shinshuensis]